MDLYRAIQELYEEKDRLERVIASLEELQRTTDVLGEMPPLPKRRGRKGMSSQERLEVSERMKNYWAGRRKEPRRPPSGE